MPLLALDRVCPSGNRSSIASNGFAASVAFHGSKDLNSMRKPPPIPIAQSLRGSSTNPSADEQVGGTDRESCLRCAATS